MAALTAARNTLKRGTYDQNMASIPVGNDIVYAGGLVSMLVSSGTGVILAGQDTDHHRCFGVAAETVDGTGSDEPRCDVHTEGEFLFDTTGADSAKTGLVALISDDQTVLTTGPSHGIIVGIITEVVSATKVWVKLNPYHVTA